MKRKYICILLCIVTLCALTGCTKPQPVETTEVSLLVGIDCNSTGIADPFSQQKLSYNPNGQLIQRSVRFGERWKTKCKYTYDTNGIPIRKVYFEPEAFQRFDKQGNLVMARTEGLRYEYTYDENDNILTSKELRNGKTTRTTYAYEHDDRGNILLQTAFLDDGRTRQTRFTYDAQGNVLSNHRTGPDDYENKTTYSYNEAGNLLTKESISFSGYREAEHYTYDEQGRTIRHIYEFPEYTRRTEYVYSENGRFVTRKIYQDDTLMSTTVTIYSHIPGQITLEATEYMHTRIQEKYAYDEKGNLILWEHTEDPLHNFNTYTYSTTFHYETVEIPTQFLDFVQEEQRELIEGFARVQEVIVD